jgi:pimeloyl-ACP methyl ester carboxylesterase
MMTQHSVPSAQPMCHPCTVLRQHAMPAFLLSLVVLFLPACATSKPTLVVLVGGAGLSQLGEVGETISALCPDADVVETGGWDGFRADLKRFVKEHPSQGLVLIGHSFGCQTIAQAAGDIQGIDLVVMIDPAWNDFTLPPTVSSCLWYQRAEDGMERRATIRNGGRPTLVNGDHNDICHSPPLIAQVARVVRDISERKAMRERLRNGTAAGLARPAPG